MPSVPARDINDLAAIRSAVRLGIPVTGWAPALRNPGSPEATDEAARRFAVEAKALLADFADGKVPPEELGPAIAASYIQHASEAFLAGKRAMGNAEPLSPEDEQDIFDISTTLGLTDSGPAPGTFGSNILRIATGGPGDYPDDIRDRLDRYIEDMTDAIYRAGYEHADAKRRRALDLLATASAEGVASARASLGVARDSKAPDIEEWEKALARAEREAKRVDEARARYASSRDGAVEELANRIRARQKVASKRFNERLGILLRKLLSGNISVSDAEEELTSLIRSENVLSFTAGRSLGGTPRTRELDQEEIFLLDDTEDEQHSRFIAALPLIGSAVGAIGGLTIANVIGRIARDPMNVKDPDVMRWVNRRVDGATARFYQLRQMGEKAAYREPGVRPVISPLSDIAPMTPARQWAPEPPPIMDPTLLGSVIMVWWRLGDAQNHCPDCVALADNSPYQLDEVEAMGLAPGSGHTECGAFCRCSLEYDVPTTLAAGMIGESDRWLPAKHVHHHVSVKDLAATLDT